MSDHDITLLNTYHRSAAYLHGCCSSPALLARWPRLTASLHPTGSRANISGLRSSISKSYLFTSSDHDGSLFLRSRHVQTTSPQPLPIPQSRHLRRRLPSTDLVTSTTHSPLPRPTPAPLHLTPHNPRLPRRRPRPPPLHAPTPTRIPQSRRKHDYRSTTTNPARRTR